MVSHKPFQRLHPLSLLAQLINRQVSGCLQVVSESTSWLIYLDQGKLTFATNSTAPLERLDRHLRQIGTLAVDTLSQAGWSNKNVADSHLPGSTDYLAIRWLVEQQHLESSQATRLIEDLAKEVIEPLLLVTEGRYEVIAQQNFEHYPNLCRLDLRSLVEQCHNRLRLRQIASQTAAKAQSSTAPREALKEPVYLSQEQVSSQASQPSATNRSHAIAPPAKSTRYTVACIDDSPTILQAISTFLDGSNFSVLMINDPVKALMQIVRSKPDVILLDVGMPNLDGYELCSLLRRHSSFKATPIVMVTGHTGFIDRARAKLVGASGYLTKPFTQAELLKTLSKHIA